MPWLPIGMAVAGLTKSLLAADQAKNQRQAQAEVTRYSPWTGMKGQSVADPSVIGDTLQGGMAGLGVQQSMDANAAQKDFMDKISSGAGNGGAASQGLANASLSPAPTGMGGAHFDNSPTASMNGAMPNMAGSAGAVGGAGMSPWAKLSLLNNVQSMFSQPKY